jgi:hypothetical protein
MIHDVHQDVCPVSTSASIMGVVFAAGRKVKLLFHDGGGGGEGDDGDGGNVTGGKKEGEE